MTITKKQFLARALLWKQKYKDAPNYKDPDFEGGKSYEYEGDNKYAIFNWARREFPYYNRFSDNKELTQRFFDDYQRGDPLLLKDINLEATTTEEQMVSGQPAEAEAVPVGAATSGESPTTMAGGIGGFGLPSGKSAIFPNPRRIVHIVPPTHPEAESSKIVIANKSGVVAEKAPSTLYVANKSGVVVEERNITPSSTTIKKPEPPPKILVADKSGNIVSPKPEIPKSNILLADSSGRVIEKPPTTPTTIHIANKGGVETGKHTIRPASKFNFPSFKSSSLVNQFKNINSSAQIFTKKAGSRFASGLSNMLGNTARTGGSLLGGAIGTGGRAAGKLGVIGDRFFNQINRGKFGLRVPEVTGRRALVIFLISFIGFTLLVGLLGGGLIPGGGTGTTPGGSLPVAGGASGVSDISQCKFTRRNKQEYSVKSSKLASLISEVAAKTGVPASVIATVAMHETLDFTAFALDDHDAFSNKGFNGVDCYPHFATSRTGALGLMQVQTPPRLKPAKADNYNPKAVDENGIRIGLNFIGKNHESLGTSDFCNIRTSLYMGAGVILSKNGGKPPLTADEVEKTVCNYFGNPCTYEGSYHYGAEAKSDFLSCQTKTPTLAGGKPNFVFYCEADPRWVSLDDRRPSDPLACHINYAGCGPTSMAMIVSSFGLIMNPVEMDKVFEQTKARSCGPGVSFTGNFFNSGWLEKNGFAVADVGILGGYHNIGNKLDLKDAEHYLKDDYYIFASSSHFPCPGSGWCRAGKGAPVDHIFVIDEVDSVNNIINVRDPINCNNVNINERASDRALNNTFGFWLYAKAIKKVKYKI